MANQEQFANAMQYAQPSQYVQTAQAQYAPQPTQYMQAAQPASAKWGEFSNYDTSSLVNEVKALDAGFQELPKGKYEVAFDVAYVGLSKAGFPKLHMQFTVLSGMYKQRVIYINQLLIKRDANDKFRIHSANELLRGLKSSREVSFEGLDAYDALVSEIEKECLNCEYELEITEPKENFRAYKLLQRFDY